MVISPQEWQRFHILKPGDFNYPDQMSPDVVRNLDLFAYQMGARPTILSDYRPEDLKQHGAGRAIDTTWPGEDPFRIWRAALHSQLFSGVGVYLNEHGVASFHFDTRLDRTGKYPAKWGAFVESGENTYVSAGLVLDQIKKKSWVLIPALALFVYYLVRHTKG